MNKLHTRKGGFTLIELMIVVAIIGILAAIAIPNFLRFQLKAKSSEGKTNLAAVRTAEQSFYSEFGSYVSSAGLAPGSVPGTAKVAFDDSGAPGFDTIGWSPEGNVYFYYGVGSTGAGFFATAMANIDGDAVEQAWGYLKEANPGDESVASGHTCDPALLAVTDQVAPCDPTFGQSVF